MWWADHGRSARCCQSASERELEQNPEYYDCASCPLRIRSDELEHVNRTAWEIFGMVAGRTVREWGLIPYTLEALTAEWDPRDRADLVQRLSLIFEILAPPEQADGHT